MKVGLEKGVVEAVRPDGVGSRPNETWIRLSRFLSEFGWVAQMEPEGEPEGGYPAAARPRRLMRIEQRWLGGFCLRRLPR